jgi:hypothetical protein
MSIIGKQVMIIGNHPHTGETGTVIAFENTGVGPGFRVNLDNCPHGTEACFVFKAEHLLVKGGERTRESTRQKRNPLL